MKYSIQLHIPYYDIKELEQFISSEFAPIIEFVKNSGYTISIDGGKRLCQYVHNATSTLGITFVPSQELECGYKTKICNYCDDCGY